MARPPNGTLVFSGLGQFPLKFYNPDGKQRTPPESNPEAGDGVLGIAALVNGKLAVIGGNTPNFGTTGVGVFSADFESSVDSAAGPNGFPNHGSARTSDGYFNGAKLRRIYVYDPDGAQVLDFLVAGSGEVIRNLAAPGEGLINYFTLASSPTVIRAWDLGGNTDLGVFLTIPAGEDFVTGSGDCCMVGNDAGELFVGTAETAPDATGYVRRYDASATLLNTYTMVGTDVAIACVTMGKTDATFWVSYYNDDAGTYSGVTVCEIDVATGAVLHTFNPEDGEFLFNASFCVIRGNIEGFLIDGVHRDILQNWSISEQLNERGTMRFGVKSMDASYRPGLRDLVDFYWVGLHFFAGHIHHTEEGALTRVPYGVVPIETRCGAVDFGALTDRRQVSLTLAAGTLKSQVITAAAELAIYGVTVDPAQVDGPSMPEMALTIGTLTAVFQKLSVSSGYAFKIDYDLVLRMFEPGIDPAPFDIVDNDERVLGDVTVSPTTVDYGNRVYVQWTAPAFPAYVYFVIDAVPSDGEQISAAGHAFTFKTSPSGQTEIQIEGSVADQRDAIIAALDPLDEIIATVQAGDAVRVTATEAGASSNSIQVSTTCVDSHWGVEGVPIASHLYNGLDPTLTPLADAAMAEDVPAQEGGANLYELVFPEPTVTNEAAAQALADGYLVRSLVQPREVRYRTRLHGLHPGMQQQIQVTGRNVDGPCLITAVEITPVGPAKYNYDVTAVEGLVIVKSHQAQWRQMQSQVA